MKKVIPYIINIILVIAIFIIALAITNTYPFGNMILGKSDAVVQYKPMLYNFIMSLKTHTITSYSFNNGLGNPTIFNFLYYLSSPLNLIALPFNKPDHMYLSVILLKISITAITITFYAKKKTNNNFISTIVCLSYVYSSWFLAYYFTIQWLDIFLIFPLLQYGLEKLLNEQKYPIYIFSLAFTLITNFYLAFSVCIYILSYFIIMKVIFEKTTIKEKINSFNHIFLSTIAAFLLASFHLYALFNSFLKTGLSFSGTINNGYTISIIDFIKSLFYGNISNITEMEGSTYPNIALNTLILINLFYYFINKKISKKEKLLALCIVLLTIAIFFIPFLDHMMNLFHNIRGFTYRYSFIPIFLIIIIFIRNVNNFDSKDINKLYIPIAIISILLLINYKNMEFNILVLNIVFILSYLVLVKFYTKNKLYNLLILSLIVIQSTIGITNNISENIDRSAEDLDNLKYQTETKTYRLNKISNDYEYLNKNLYTNDDVTYLLSSMTYNNVITLSYKLGCSTYETSQILCSDYNELYNMLFNVKNDYYLEKIYAVNNEVLLISLDEYNTKNSYEFLIESMTDIKDIYDSQLILGTKTNKDYKFNVDNNYYLIDFVTEDYTINLPQTYTEFTSPNESYTIYTPNEDKLKEIHDTLKQNQIQYTSYSDNKIEGTIRINKDQIIFTSIPYDPSWEVKIDGKKIEPIIVLDSLLGIECEEGTHTISLEYKNNYIIPAIISLSTLVTIIILTIKKKKQN